MVAAVLALFLVVGCFGPTVQKPAPQGKLCDYNVECAAESFLSCDKSYGTLTPDTNTSFYFQVIGPEETNCSVYVQLIKATGIPDFMSGLDAICIVTPMELAQKFGTGANIDISEMNCTGPLYEAAKAAQALQGAPIN